MLITTLTMGFYVGTLLNGNMSFGVEIDSIDGLIFKSGNSIKIELTDENFWQQMGSVSNEMTTSAVLKKAKSLEYVQDKYHVILDVYQNEFDYTTSSQSPEIILQVKDPDDNLITSAENLVFVETKDPVTNEIIKGFDITNVSGVTRIVTDYLIFSDTMQEVVHDWDINIIFLNLTDSQNNNAGRKLRAELILTTDKTYRASLPYVELLEQNYNPTLSNWVNEDIEVLINVNDPNGLGIVSSKYCISDTTCIPETEFTDDLLYTTYYSKTKKNFSLSSYIYDYKYKLVLDEENDSVICVNAENVFGQITTECTRTYKIDKTAPLLGELLISGTKGENDWYITPVNISTTDSTDLVSGIDVVTLNKTQIYESSISEDIIMTAYDNAGNTSKKTENIKVDLNPPVIIGVSDKSFNKNEVINLLTGVSCIDDASSLNNCQVTLNAENLNIYVAGEYIVTYTATDLAGHTATSEAKIIIDADAPVLNIIPDPLAINANGLWQSLKKFINSY